MKVVLQKVLRADVRVGGAVTGKIAAGYLLLIGVHRDDGPVDVDLIARKIVQLRLWPSETAAWQLPITSPQSILAVSQFTLVADTTRGNRPSFDQAAPPDVARPLYESLVARLRAAGLEVAEGVFQSHMEVESVNDGPVTLILDSRA